MYNLSIFKKCVLLGLAASSAFYQSDAEAHARWTLDGETPPRSESAGIKVGPCGDVPRTNTPAVFAPGETITVTWEETIDHQGHFIISFSSANDDGFEQNILKGAAELPDDQNGTPVPHLFSTEITLPDIECDDCTLQLIQYMERSNSNYYSCADIKLQAGGAPIEDDPDEDAQRPEEQWAELLLADFEALDINPLDNMLSFNELDMLEGMTLELFDLLDSIDGDGFLTREELQLVAIEIGDGNGGGDGDGGAGGADEGGAAGGLIGFMSMLLVFYRRKKASSEDQEGPIEP